jgi:hypothetical protein
MLGWALFFFFFFFSSDILLCASQYVDGMNTALVEDNSARQRQVAESIVARWTRGRDCWVSEEYEVNPGAFAPTGDRIPRSRPHTAR